MLELRLEGSSPHQALLGGSQKHHVRAGTWRRRVQHEGQKHSLGWEGRWACEKPKTPTRSPPFPASPQALARSPCPILLRPVVWCEPQTLNRTIVMQSGKDGDGRKHRDGGAQRRP